MIFIAEFTVGEDISLEKTNSGRTLGAPRIVSAARIELVDSTRLAMGTSDMVGICDRQPETKAPVVHSTWSMFANGSPAHWPA